jgi:hypothetical protein
LPSSILDNSDSSYDPESESQHSELSRVRSEITYQDRNNWKFRDADGKVPPSNQFIEEQRILRESHDVKQWLKEPKGKRKSWLGIVCAPMMRWVSIPKPADDNEEEAIKQAENAWTFHAVAVAIIQKPNGGGKVLLIHVCDRTPPAKDGQPSRVRSEIGGTAIKELYRGLRNGGKCQVKVLINDSSPYRGEGFCLDHALAAFARWSVVEDGEWDGDFEEGEITENRWLLGES